MVKLISMPGADSQISSTEIVNNLRALDTMLLSRVYAQMQVVRTVQLLQRLNSPQ